MDHIPKPYALQHQKMVCILYLVSTDAVLTVCVLFLVPSGSPLNFGGSATSSRSASISWQPPPDDQWNGVIIVYVINVTVVETGLTFQLNSTTTSLTVNTLQPYRNYICIVAAVTSVGTGPFSGRFTLTTPQDGNNSSIAFF